MSRERNTVLIIDKAPSELKLPSPDFVMCTQILVPPGYPRGRKGNLWYRGCFIASSLDIAEKMQSASVILKFGDFSDCEKMDFVKQLQAVIEGSDSC